MINTLTKGKQYRIDKDVKDAAWRSLGIFRGADITIERLYRTVAVIRTDSGRVAIDRDTLEDLLDAS